MGEVLTVMSDYDESEPQYIVHLTPPERGNLLSLFHLVRSVGDSLRFKLEAGRWVFEPYDHDFTDTTWHADLGRLVEKHFQPELQELFHSDWDRYKLIWNDEEHTRG